MEVSVLRDTPGFPEAVPIGRAVADQPVEMHVVLNESLLDRFAVGEGVWLAVGQILNELVGTEHPVASVVLLPEIRWNVGRYRLLLEVLAQIENAQVRGAMFVREAVTRLDLERRGVPATSVLKFSGELVRRAGRSRRNNSDRRLSFEQRLGIRFTVERVREAARHSDAADCDAHARARLGQPGLVRRRLDCRERRLIE